MFSYTVKTSDLLAVGHTGTFQLKDTQTEEEKKVNCGRFHNQVKAPDQKRGCRKLLIFMKFDEPRHQFAKHKRELF